MDTQWEPGKITLRKLLLLDTQANVYLEHKDLDAFVPIGGITPNRLSEETRVRFKDLLDATVEDIRPGPYGINIEISGVNAELLEEFDNAHAAYYRGQDGLSFQ